MAGRKTTNKEKIEKAKKVCYSWEDIRWYNDPDRSSEKTWHYTTGISKWNNRKFYKLCKKEKYLNRGWYPSVSKGYGNTAWPGSKRYV